MKLYSVTHCEPLFDGGFRHGVIVVAAETMADARREFSLRQWPETSPITEHAAGAAFALWTFDPKIAIETVE